MRLLVTGATGFVGQRLATHLLDRGNDVVAMLRDADGRSRVDARCEPFIGGDLMREGDLPTLPVGIDGVIHLAARVHVLNDSATDAEARYRRLNVEATIRLARAAIDAGARRFVFVSSVKAAAEASSVPLRESDAPAPLDPYGRSKLAAEAALFELGASTGLEVVVVRPPLVYGPGVRGNFRRLLTLAWYARRIPLPLGGIGNRRSLVFVGNLASALACVASHPSAPGELFYVSDDADLSTSELVAALATSLGGAAKLFAPPMTLVRMLGAATGRSGEIDRLFGSLRVDASKLRRHLGWEATYPARAGLDETAAWYQRAVRA